jgi:hypothetical protein
MSTNYQRFGNSQSQPNINTRSNIPTGRTPLTVHQAAPPETPIKLQPILVDRLVTTRQAADILGVSTDTLKKWRQRPGKGPKFIRYPSGAIRYRLSTIMKFLEVCTVQP